MSAVGRARVHSHELVPALSESHIQFPAPFLVLARREVVATWIERGQYREWLIESRYGQIRDRVGGRNPPPVDLPSPIGRRNQDEPRLARPIPTLPFRPHPHA